MSASDISPIIFGSLIGQAPYLAAWIAATVVAVIMLRRGGDTAERFLLIGASLMLVQSIITIPTTALGTWLIVGRGMNNVEAASMLSVFGLIRGCIGLAGIICLVYAFWVKFKARSTTGLTPKD